MDHLNKSLQTPRDTGAPRVRVDAAQPDGLEEPAALFDERDVVQLQTPRVRDESILHPPQVASYSDETMGELHKKVDHASDDRASDSEEDGGDGADDGEANTSRRLQPQLAQKSRGLVEKTIRQRTQGRSGERQEGRAATGAQPDETARQTRALAEGIIPSMMEGLLNQGHRKDRRDKKDAARLMLIILKAHGAYVYEHCTRLVDLAMSLAREMGQADEQLGREVEEGMTYRDVGEVAFFLTRRSARQRDALAAYLAGVDLAQESMLHDLGKIQVPEDILYKPGPLTPDERRIMQRHPVWGAEILEGIPPLHHAIPVTRHHHERWDGQGYPDGFAGNDIPLAARIVCVVDAFDAMVSDRPYRKGLPFAEACEIIREGSGTQFDPQVAQAFLRIADKVWSPERQY